MNSPLGPDDTNNAKELINQRILCSNDMEGLGMYATLLVVEPNKQYPYRVKLEYNGNVEHFAWIVKY